VIAVADLSIALVGLLMIGVGLWWHDPGASLAVVGGVLVVMSVLSRFRGVRND